MCYAKQFAFPVWFGHNLIIKVFFCKHASVRTQRTQIIVCGSQQQQKNLNRSFTNSHIWSVHKNIRKFQFIAPYQRTHKIQNWTTIEIFRAIYIYQFFLEEPSNTVAHASLCDDNDTKTYLYKQKARKNKKLL